MAKKVNNINYKGINHSPSLVSDNDGHASECANLSPDFNDLKPMPMPVCSNYTLQPFAKLVFVHRGVGFENYIELDQDGIRLYIKDSEGHFLYYSSPGSPDWPWWWNQSEILSVEAVGNTLVVSTKEGTEYIVYQPDVPAMGLSTGGSYKPIGQKPPMPVIEFRLNHEYRLNGRTYGHAYIAESTTQILDESGESIPMGAHQTNDVTDAYTLPTQYKDIAVTELGGLIETNIKKAAEEGKFVFPFFIRYAYRMRTGDYIMHSPSVLMLPSTDKSPHLCLVKTVTEGGIRKLDRYRVVTPYSILQYKTEYTDIEDWKDMISSVDIFISSPSQNYYPDYRTDDENEGYLTGVMSIYHWFYDIHDIDFGQCYSDGKIIDLVDEVYSNDGGYSTACYHLESVDSKIFHKSIEDNSLFHKVASLELSELTNMQDYDELSLENLANLATLPTLSDDHNSHCSISSKLMQTYNSRLNMANISQKIFVGFKNAFQPQSEYNRYDGTSNTIIVDCVFFKIKKNGKTYVIQNDGGTGAEKLDYTTYLYYPDPDCYEMTVKIRTGSTGSMVYTTKYYTVPMKRHEYLNGSYWYEDMKCLGEFLEECGASSSSESAPSVDTDLWYDIPNRFMMSSVGNPWYFPLQETFDIGLKEIRALSINAENMDAPQFGQNPIYVFSTDGIWTIGINKDGTHNGISYVSGDVISEMQGLGVYPTASAPQIVFFKTARGIMAVTGSKTKEIDAVMKGRVFNPMTKLLPSGSIINGVPTSGINSYWLDLIYSVCDDLPYADFAKDSNLMYDYRNNRLLLFNSAKRYLYVYDIKADFWSKMLPMYIDESPTSPAQQEFNDRGRTPSYVTFTGMAMVGNDAVLTDDEWQLWYVGDQTDENDIANTQFGLYVSRPMRFGTDDYKTLSRVVHDYQTTYLENSYQNDMHEYARMGLWGSRNGKDYYQINTLRGTSYKFFIIALYTRMLPSSRYAYTAFEWEPRMTDKIR